MKKKDQFIPQFLVELIPIPVPILRENGLKAPTALSGSRSDAVGKDMGT